MPKKRRRNMLPEEDASPARFCAWDGCGDRGEFRGPSRHMPASLLRKLGIGVGINEEATVCSHDEAPHYCGEHIRHINKSWNFFDGMSPEVMRAFERDALTGHRATRLSHQHIGNLRPEQMEALYAQALKMRTGRTSSRAQGPSRPAPEGAVPREIKEALALFQLTLDCTEAALKKRYRELVKTWHPDGKPGDIKKKAEEMLKRINEAYRVLKGYKAPI